MEVELLKEMAHDRDVRIASIKRKMEDQSQKHVRLIQEMKEVRNDRLKRSDTNRQEWERLQIDKNAHEKKLTRMLNDLRKQQGQAGSSTLFAMYADVMGAKLDGQNNTNSRDNNNHAPGASGGAGAGVGALVSGIGSKLGIEAPAAKTDNSAMITRMQAQLCKVMHSLGIIDNQMQLVQSTCDSLIKSLKDVLTAQTEEKSMIELKLMNELMSLDDQRKTSEENFKHQQAKFKRQIQKFEGKQDDDDDDEDDDDSQESDDSDEEEEEVDDEKEKGPAGKDDASTDGMDLDPIQQKKAQIRHTLQERKQQAQQLEGDIEEQKDMIRAVKVRLSLLDMQANGDNDDDKEEDETDEDETSEDDDDEEEDPERHLSMVAEIDEEKLSERV